MFTDMMRDDNRRSGFDRKRVLKSTSDLVRYTTTGNASATDRSKNRSLFRRLDRWHARGYEPVRPFFAPTDSISACIRSAAMVRSEHSRIRTTTTTTTMTTTTRTNLCVINWHLKEKEKEMYRKRERKKILVRLFVHRNRSNKETIFISSARVFTTRQSLAIFHSIFSFRLG